MNNIIIPKGYNKCSKCGYDKCFFAIDFHHKNPKEKKYQIGLMLRQKITPIRLAEIEKVIPLCRNCHAEEHWILLQTGGNMNDFKETIGQGGAWIHTSKKGTKYMSGIMNFLYNGHSVEAKFLIFKNNKKEENSKQPDYVIKVTDAFPAKAKEVKKPEPKQEPKTEEDIPF